VGKIHKAADRHTTQLSTREPKSASAVIESGPWRNENAGRFSIRSSRFHGAAMMPRAFFRLSLPWPSLVLLSAAACGSSNDQRTGWVADSAPNSAGNHAGTDSANPATGSGGAGGRAEPDIGLDNPDAGATSKPNDATCASASAGASLVKQPVDVILVIDNSGSMKDEIAAVEKNINNNFASILAASQIDYRVILISRHGSSASNESICISSPLSGNQTCSPVPDKPANAERFFHYSTKIESNDSFAKILATYNTPDSKYKLTSVGWSEWLRPGARRAFLEITDDKSDTSSMAFDSALLALKPQNFGTASARNYVWHSIVGMKEKSPATAAWMPSEPLQNATCTGNGGDVEAPGLEYQELSRLTGGLRFPLCEWTSYDVVFKAIADDVVTTTGVACDFAIPAPPSGQTLNLQNVAVRYTSKAGGAPHLFKQALSAEKCVPEAFYLQAGRIALCPAACSQVQADPSASVDVLFTCQSTVIVN
jgi:hypothetical protein